MGMKKHGSKKDALPLENSKKEPQRLTWKSKYEQICASHVSNGTEEPETKDEDEIKTNALDGLSGYLSSEDDSSSGESELNEEVQTFLQEVDKLYEEDKKKQALNNLLNVQPETPSTTMVAANPTVSEVPTVQYEQTTAPTVSWQECYDSTTGFTYYWNMETNEVTWDMPAEYQSYMEALKQWQQYQAQGVAALLQARVQQQLQQHQQLLLQQAQEQLSSAKQEIKPCSLSKGKKKTRGNHSDSEDEKIELITSYGPFSDDESSDTEQLTPKPPKIKKKKIEVKSPSPPKHSMGPQLPPGGNKILKPIEKSEKPKVLTNSLVPYHPEYDDSDSEDPLENSKLNFVPDNGPPGAEPEKLSPSSSPKAKDEVKDEEIVLPIKSESKEISREEEDDESTLLDRLKSQTQVLKELGGEIPEEVKSIITESPEKEESKVEETKLKTALGDETKNLKLKLSARAKKLISASTTTAKARATNFIHTPDGLKPIQRNKEDETEPSSSSRAAGEGGEKRKLWLGMSTSLLSSDICKGSELKVREEGNRGGFGFVPSSDGKKRLKTDKIAFVKADTLLLSEEDQKGSSDVAESEPSPEEQVDIKEASGVLLDKMKFLSVGKEPVPPVQVWIIQLETLLSAWEGKHLKRNFLEDWLMKTTKEIESLECSVAPDGWVCEWQREEKRYQYRKTLTGEVTWEFPAAATGGGEEEMDLSTTPPPPPCTPPPPTISVPSPPSPPNISTSIPVPDDLPPLPADIPPLPPLPPSDPPSPPPPPPVSPPPQPPLHPSQPLPPGVDPPDLPPLPPSNQDFPSNPPPPPPPTVRPSPPLFTSQYYQPFPTPSQPPQPFPTPSQPPQPQPPHLQPTVVPDSSPPLPPPPPPAVSHDLSSELDSFYNDLATLEPELPPPLPPSDPPLPPLPPPVLEDIDRESDRDKDKKKKKKAKLAPGLSLKKKGVSSLVAKWQQVQEDVRRDMKHD